MTIKQMREAIIDAYAGPVWRMKVQTMKENQVVAIYRNMLERGQIGQKPHKNATKFDEKCVQMTIWDYMTPENKEK